MVKSTIKLQLWKHNPNSHGHQAIYLRITVDRKTTYLSTGKYLASKFWDASNEMVKSGHPMADTWNLEITTLKTDVARIALDLAIAGQPVTAASLKSLQGKQDIPAMLGTNFFDFVERFCGEVKHKRGPATLENYRKHALKLELFNGSKDLTFEQIDVDYLTRFEMKMRETVGSNYANSIFKTMRTFFNAAIKRELVTHYPFKKFEMPVYRAPGKHYLTLDDLAKWERVLLECNDKKGPMMQAGVYFLLGCYTGLRISDWYKFNIAAHVHDGYIRLKATKNLQQVVVPISAPMARNLPRIANTPLLIDEPVINRTLKKIAEKAEINKRVTTHVGRHTFAIEICANQGISAEVTATLMGITIQTCINAYYRITAGKIQNETAKAWKNL